MSTFTSYLQSLGQSNSSALGNNRYFLDYVTWCDKENIETEFATHNEVVSYIQYLGKRNIKQATIAGYLIGIKHYYNWLISRELITHNPCMIIKIKGIKRKKLYTILSKQELEELYHNFVFTTDEKQKNQNWYKLSEIAFKRNKIILGLLIYQGINASELGNLTINDLKLREGKIYIAGTRRSNERELTLEAVQIMDLMEYTLKYRAELLNEFKKESNHLIISAGTGHTINNTLTKLMQKLTDLNPNIENLQQIRTSVITHWLKTHNLRRAQHMAGHRYVSSTEAYLVNDLEDLLEDITKFHPIG